MIRNLIGVGLAVSIVVGLPLGATAADNLSFENVQRAVEDLQATYGKNYAGSEAAVKKLSSLHEKIAKALPHEQAALQEQFNQVARGLLLANPLVSKTPIVFVTREQYPGDHHNTATMFQTGEINANKFHGPGAIKTLKLAHDESNPGGVTPDVKTILDVPEGVARDLEMSFDGKKVLFSMRTGRADDYHLYEMNIDGSDLTQLTFGGGISDIDPIYLPDDKIMFTSTREPKFCMCNRHIMGNLFTMEADGANIQQVGHSTLHEGHPSLTPDGRVIYDRWEYVDRNFGDAQGVWSTNPDGTAHAIYWGNNTNSPGGVLDARTIPGTQKFISTFSSCHDRPWGAIAIVDRRRGIDGKDPVERTWPPKAIELVGKGNYDTFRGVNPKYEDPYPLSDKYFLCVRTFGQGEKTGIYLIDTFGNELLIHADESNKMGCYDPMPLAARERPPAIPDRTELKRPEGDFFVADVYQGSGMENVERGTVKYLRVVESPEKRFWTQQAWMGSGTQAPGMAFDDFNNKRIIGTVPVEEDGSAFFTVPADTHLYFQLLDDKGMMVQSMRSGVIARPGEVTSCVGCHDNRRAAVPYTGKPKALLSEPQKTKDWYGKPRNFNYVTEVQPVFDKNCVSCHDYGKPAGEKLNLAGDLGLMFNTSYLELRSKRYVKVVGAGPFRVQAPKSWGAHASRLAQVLVEGHGDAEIDKKIKLSDEDFDRIVTWIDINAPYYPEYASAYRNNRYGRSPIDNGQLGRLAQLTGLNLNDQKLSSHVSFTRPEKSLCLQKLEPNSAAYKEAIGIIRAGQGRLAVRPRADMPNFQLTDPIEIAAEEKYRERLAIEEEMRAAIAEGQRKYEEEQQ